VRPDARTAPAPMRTAGRLSMRRGRELATKGPLRQSGLRRLINAP
jgi:hypothetical protein